MSDAISKKKEDAYKEALRKAKNKIEQLQAENAQLSSENKKCEIAVTGYSCRFPSGANSPEEYWKRLAEGFDAVSEIKRFDVDSIYDSTSKEPGKMTTRYASFLDVNIKEFDNTHFNISAVEAKSIDPQYRLIMEVCWEALLEAGEDPEKLKGSKTGVFIGIDSFDYSLNEFLSDKYSKVGPYTIMGISQHAAAGRISYYFDWKGPAIVCNTACSSSLSALNCAISSLKNGQCDMAVVGGVNLLLDSIGFIGLSQFNSLSPDGRCKTFDAFADGFGRGEGCGVIILKRLDEAEKHKRNIRAIIKGIYAGQDGKSNGFYAPNGKAEQRVIENAIENAMVSVDDIDYVETHGTGTVLGDLIESQALCGAFKNKKNKLKIGSVKSNIGHLEAASGMASIIKVLLSMKHHMLPPSINIKQLNPEINWNKLEVVQSLTEWKKEDGSPLIAGISSFGISGALVHTIVESYEKSENKEDLLEIPCSLLTVSAKNEKQLRASIKAAKDYIEENPEKFNDIIYSMQKCRSTLPIKYAVCGKDGASICAEIQSSLDSEEVFDTYSKEPSAKKHKIAFLFTGQGAIYKDIAIEIYNCSPVYRKYFDLCNELFIKTLSVSIRDAVFGENEDWLNRAVYSQAVTFSVEYSLYQYWISLGIEPDIMLGHSIGEYAAACASGVMTLEYAVQMISWRGQMMDSVEPTGKMMGILSDRSSVEAAISEIGTMNAGVAACNADNNVTLAGLADAVDEVINCLQKKKRVFVNDLNIPYPFHTNLMSHYEADYSAKMAKINFSKPDKTIVSTVTADNDGSVFAYSHYWAEHLSKTVRFAEAIRKVKELGADIYIEIGGAATLTGLSGQCLGVSDDMLFLPSLRKGKSAYAQISETIQQLYLNGVEISYDALYTGLKHSYTELYPYQFQKKEFWIENNQDSDKELPKTIVESEKVVMSEKKKKGNKVKEKLLNDIKMITGNNIEDIRTDQELFSLGLDSIMLLTLGKKIESTYNLEIPMDVFFTKLNTIDALSEYLGDVAEEVQSEETVPVQPVEDVKKAAEIQPVPANSSIPFTIPVYNVPSVNVPGENGDDISSLFNRQLSIMQEQLSVIKMLGGQMRVGQTFQAPEQSVQKKAETPKKEVKKMDTSFYKPYHKNDYKSTDTSLVGSKEKYVNDIIEKYNKKMPTSKEYLSKYIFTNANERHNSGFKREFKEMFYQVLAKDAHGSHIVDFDGNDFIDLTMGFGVNFFGFAPEFVTKAIEEEVKHGFAISVHNKKTGEVAALISELTGNERVNFCNSGTEADMFAIRIARATTGKKKIVFFGGAYHGTSDGLLGLPIYNEDGSISTTSLIPGLPDESVSNLIILGYNSQASLDYIAEHSDEIAGVLVEAVQSRRPDLQPREFLHKLRKLTEENNIALIFDEVITGFRICAGGAEEYFGVKADIVTYGKVVGGGMPMGIVAGSAKYMNSVDGGVWRFGDDSVPEYEEQRTIVMGTFCHHPLTMAASYATLSHIKAEKDNIYPEINKKAEYFIKTLNTFFEEEKVPFHMVNFGTLFRFVIPKEYEVFFYSMITKGIFVWAGRNCFLCTEHTNEEIDRIISAVKETTHEMKAAGFFSESSTLKTYTGVEDRCASADGVITKPASLIQQRLYLEIKVNETDPYDIVSAYSTKKKIDENQLESALNKIVQRHEILRTSFAEEDGQIVMKIHPSCEIKIKRIESHGDNEKLIQQSIKAFDLSKAPLFEVIVIKNIDEYVLVFHFHHIVADGISMDVFSKELSLLLNNEKLIKLKGQYQDYVDYEKNLMTEEWIKERKEFWLNELQDCVTRISLPYDKNPERVTMAGSTFVDYIQKTELQNLKAASRKIGVSLFMMLLSVIDVVLYKISGEKSFAITTPVTTRFAGEFEANIGMFTNTMALGCHIEPSASFANFLKQIKKNSLSSYSKSDYPFNMLVNDIGARDQKAINVSFIYEKIDGRDPYSESSLDLNNIPYIKPIQENELLFEFLEKNDTIEMQIGYQTDLFEEKTVARICGYIHKTIVSVVEDYNVFISDIDILSVEEKQLILNDFNATETDYPRNKTIVELFEAQVNSTPENTAIIFEDKKLTYAELNSKANSLAHKLRALGVKPDDFVAIIAERSIEMICGIYGIIKAGGAYVPIDPTYPEDRIAFMLEDCQPKAVLKYTTESITINNEISVIDLADSKVWEGISENPKVVNKPEDAIYCIYTSGTTGKPKGVMLQNSSVVNYCYKHSYSVMDYAYKNDLKTILSVTNMVFDIFVTELHLALINGFKIILASSAEQVTPEKLSELIHKYKPDIMQTTPSRIKMILSDNKKENGMDQLKYIMIGGEKVERDLVNKLRTQTAAVIENVYGPTETTVWSTCCEVDKKDGQVSIGKPISNTQVYIINENNLCGVGVPGELCIAGDGLARGYLNRMELTAEKFVKNPYGKGKMYRTGDLARWLPDGNIEYLGRIDEQVKIRGFRIELGEIDSKIREIESIKDCAVIAKADSTGDKAIYAYYTSDKKVSVSEIRDRLSESLPEYMVPSYMMQIEVIPVNKNGKLDKKSLPEIAGQTTREYIAPRNEIEEKICNIFSEILNVEKVGAKDGFFELGGHSLRATRLVNRIEAETGTRITLKEVFSHPTVEQLAVLASDENEEYVPIPKAEKKEYYPMSSAQKRTYLIQQMQPESVTYNMPANLKLIGEVCADDMRAALQKMIERHEILRTQFLMIDGEPVQKIVDHVEADFEYVTSRESDEKLMAEFLKPFDLASGKLVRIKLVNKGEYHLMMFDIHHIISDGMSVNILKKELMSLYNGEENEVPIRQFKDYSEWMNSRDLSKQAEYWKSQFCDEIPVLDMPVDFPRPQEQSYKGAMLYQTIDEDISNNIRSLVKKSGTTEYMVFLAAAMVTLSKYSRQEDIVIGSPISGRTHRDTEGMLGMFVNTLAMRGKPEKDKTFIDFLTEIKEICLKAYENQEYPFEELVDAVDVQRDISRNPIFDVMLVMQNNERKDIKFKGIEAEEIEGLNTIAMVDILFGIEEIDKKYCIGLEYCTDLFNEETAKLILQHFEDVLRETTTYSNKKIVDIEMFSVEEKNLILNEFNATDLDYPRDKTVVQLFEECVKKTPDKTAVIIEDEKLTYSELNEKANCLAHKLRALGVRPNDFVAIIADRSLEIICGIYGIMKSGGAYVPIDPTYPKERIIYMLEDCKPKAILKFTANNVDLDKGIPIIDLSDCTVFEGNYADPEFVNKPDDLMYCIYTSGTTGNPKGVMIEYSGISRLIGNCKSEFEFCSDDVFLLFASISFDASVAVYISSLVLGAKLVMLDQSKVNDPTAIKKVVEKNNVNILQFPPQFAAQYEMSDAKVIFTSGSEANIDVTKEILKYADFVNAYGPTETSVCATYLRLRKGEDVNRRITIGKPHSNVKVYILNENNLCGIGVPGELCIAGDGIARGYLNSPDLTAEKFVNNLFGEGRMYRTGDLAKWLPDGNIDFLGRIDEQVKIRGFRIELGEIESRIREIEKIKDCAVIAKADSTGDKAIYAYYTSDDEVSVSEIRDRLSESMPEYMVPAYIMQIESIPVTRNGKLDKRALPEVENKNTRKYVAPRNEAEEAVCQAFSEILGVKRVGIQDYFFELGGDSIKAIRIISLLRNAGYVVTVKDIMNGKTAEKIAVYIKKKSEGKKYDQGEVTGKVESTPIIKAFGEWGLSRPEYFNQSIIFQVNDVENKMIKQAIEILVKHHDILRAVYRNKQLEILPISKSKLCDFYEFDYSSKTDKRKIVEDKCNEIQGSIDLENGPLVKIAVFDLGNEKQMLFCVHHLVIDGVSWRILLEDFETIISKINAGKEVKLPDKTASFIEWSRMLNAYGKKLGDKEKKYWKNMDAKIADGRIEVNIIENEYGETWVNFNKETTEKILTKSSNAYGAKTDEVLLAGLARAVGKITGQKNVAIRLEGHGREEINEPVSIDRTVGWFTNVFAVSLECCEDIDEAIINTKDTIRSVPNMGIGYGFVEHEAEPDICFNYLGDFSNSQIKYTSNYSSGNEISVDNDLKDKILMNGQVINGELIFSLKCKFSQSFTERLKNKFEEEIKFIADYCGKINNDTLTSSDMIANQLEKSEVEFLNQLFD